MWTEQARKEADEAWLAFKVARNLERKARACAQYQSAESYRQEADTAYFRWEAACKAAGLL